MNASWRPFGALAMTTLLCGCAPTVLDPLQGDGDEVVDDGPDEQGEPSAIAMYMSQWNLAQSSGQFFRPEPVSETAPDDLVLFFGSEAQACAAPVIQREGQGDAMCDSGPFWQTILVVPADRAAPGLIDLDDPSIFAYQASWMQDGSCGGGFGNRAGIPGTLEIVSLDATSVSMSLELVSSEGWPDPSGDHVAALCP